MSLVRLRTYEEAVWCHPRDAKVATIWHVQGSNRVPRGFPVRVCMHLLCYLVSVKSNAANRIAAFVFMQRRSHRPNVTVQFHYQSKTRIKRRAQ